MTVHAENLHAEIELSSPTSDPAPALDPMIYGHFLEQAFFRNIEGGVFEEGSPLSVPDDEAAGPPNPLAGCRQDVIEACRELGVPVVRWPGGNFTSAYWWQDGIGPRDERPRRLELAWGSEETNRFGTPEFLAWCEATGTTAYLAHSCRSVEDAVRWVEYTNYAGDTTLTRRRAADGLTNSHPVRIWGLGNEVYGPWQMGHRSVTDYVADAVEHAQFMRGVDPDLKFVAVGDLDPAWTREVVRGLGEMVDWISVHAYGADFHLVDPSREEWEAVVAQSVYFDRVLQEASETIAREATRCGTRSPLAISMDEWNMRHHEPTTWPEPEAGQNGDIAARDTSGAADEPGAAGENGWRVSRYSPRTLADALFYAGVFHAVHRTAGNTVPVTMTNTVNMINAHGILVAREQGLLRSATYYVYDLYQNHFGDRTLPVQVAGPSRTQKVRHLAGHTGEGHCTEVPETVALLDASASASADGSTHYLAVINRSADQDVTAQVAVDGQAPRGAVQVRTLGADVEDLWAHNTFEAPERIVTRADVVEAAEPADANAGPAWTYTFPAHSLTVLEWRAG